MERYKHLPEIRRIHRCACAGLSSSGIPFACFFRVPLTANRHRQIPKPVFQALKVRMEMKKAAKKREENRRKHSKKVPMRARTRHRSIAFILSFVCTYRSTFLQAAEEPRPAERKRHIVEVVE